jgi:hypothetical protein
MTTATTTTQNGESLAMNHCLLRESQDGHRLAAEAVEGAALALERVDDVHGGDRLAARVLRVGDGVADDVLEEDLEHAAGLLVDEPRDALHAAPPGQPPDRRLGDPLDVVTEHLPVALRAALSQPLAAFAAPRHCRRRSFLLTREGAAESNRLGNLAGEWIERNGSGGGRHYVEEGDECGTVGLGRIRVRGVWAVRCGWLCSDWRRNGSADRWGRGVWRWSARGDGKSRVIFFLFFVTAFRWEKEFLGLGHWRVAKKMG